MKLPSLYCAIALGTGICAPAAHPFPAKLACGVAAVSLLLAAGLWRLWPRLWHYTFVLVMLGWLALGVFAVRVQQHSEPANLPSRLIASGDLDLKEPLRWRGILGENIEQLPWGVRFDVELESVDYSGVRWPVSGGLRASYFGNERQAVDGLRAGDRVELLAQARLPKNYGDPGAFDYVAQLARERIDLTATVRSLALVNRVDTSRLGLHNALARARGTLLKRVDELFPEAPARRAVVRAILLGDRSFVDNDVSDAFRATSSYHVLVIAGLHVAALTAFIVWCCGRFRLGRTMASILTILVLAAYVGVVQDRPPVLRAALVAAAYLLGRIFFRRMDILQAAALAAAVILLVRPDELMDPSFQLSFLAVAAIGGIALPWLNHTAEPLRRALQHVKDVTRDAAFAPRLAQLRLDLRAMTSAVERRLPFLGRFSAGTVTAPLRFGLFLWEAIVISTIIQLGLTPLLVDDFHRVGAIGLIANIPAVLLTGLIVPLGFLALSFSFVSQAVSRALAHLEGVAVAALLKTVNWFAAFHVATLRVPDLPLWLTITMFAGLLLLAVAVRNQLWRLSSVAAVLVGACGLAAAIHPFAPDLPRGKLQLTVLDVGQGDSLFLAVPDGRTMVIDGGGSPGALRISGMKTRFDIGEEVVSPYLWSRGLKHLNVVALTHAHEDHLEGLTAVLKNFRVDELWVGHDVNLLAYRQLLQLARARAVKVVHLEQGDHFAWDTTHLEVLWPDTTSEVQQATNDDSLVLRVQFKNQALLLTGDIEKSVEARLTAEDAPLSAQFLKVPHHGSATSSTEQFLALVRPAFAAISVGENNQFNHPSPATLTRLRAAGAEVFRTDQDGAVTVTTDGNAEWVQPFKTARAEPAPTYLSHGR
jgi:competence protein ComEC